MNPSPTKKQFKISRDFSRTPGPRFREEGDWSGEVFRESYLLPFIQNANAEGAIVLVDLDGTAGLGTSFLEESFGGLVRHNHYSQAELLKLLDFKSSEEPFLVEDIMTYIKDAEIEKNSLNSTEKEGSSK